MELQKIKNYESDLEEKSSKLKVSSTFQIILQGSSNQNSTKYAQKQTHKLMEQNRELRIKPKHLWLINL